MSRKNSYYSLIMIFGSPTERLNTHILRIDSVRRWFMSGFGFLLPLLLVFGGLWRWFWLEEPLAAQNSFGFSYHARSYTALEGIYRDMLVGLLTTIGFLLIVYSGFEAVEGGSLNSDDRLMLWIEWAGMWTFCLCWLFKSIEILIHKIDVDVVDGRVHRVGIDGLNRSARLWWKRIVLH